MADANVTPPAATGPAPGTPEYQAAMIAKAQGSVLTVDGKRVDTTSAPAPTAAVVPPTATTTGTQTTPPTITTQKPDGLPDKFWDATTGTVRVDALAKSYTELERSRTAPVTPPAVTPPPVVTPPVDAGAPVVPVITPPVTPPPAVVDPAAAMHEARQVATQELAKPEGKLSDESYARFEKLGFDRQSVDAYVAGQRAIVGAYVNSMYETAGGKDSYNAMVGWARTALDASEAAAFDTAVRSNDSGSMKMAVSGLKARFAAEFGKGATTTITPNPADTLSTSTAFQSQQEMVAAMKDPRYQKGDPAYHREVAEKIAASARQKINLNLRVQQSGNVR
jgi:hypothetical protein